MKPSKELQTQLDRLSNTGAFAVSTTLKKELQELTVSIGVNKLINLDCGTCVRQSMHQVNAHFRKSTPVLSMNMVKSVNEMTFSELRKSAKAKGFKINRQTTKPQLIKFLSND